MEQQGADSWHVMGFASAAALCYHTLHMACLGEQRHVYGLDAYTMLAQRHALSCQVRLILHRATEHTILSFTS